MTRDGRKPGGVDRQKRYQSHALVDFKKNRWLPIGIHSGVLLDLSMSGFKMEFTGEVKANSGSTYWISIPLSPLGILAPAKFNAKIKCRWFDQERYRIGGTFSNLSESDKLILQKVIEKLDERGLAQL